MRRAVLVAALATAAAGIVPGVAQASFSVAANAGTASESAGTATFTVSRGGLEPLSPGSSTVSISVTGGAGAASPASLTFGQNDTASKPVTVPIDDDADQSNDPHPVTVTIAVSSSTVLGGESVGTPSATTQVTDNDTTIDVAPASGSAGEGGALTLTLTPRAQVDHAITATYATAPGTASADTDYTSQSGTLTWPAGTVDAKTVTIPTANDALDEDDETLTLSLGIAGSALSATSVPLTIADDDPPPLVGAVGARVAEGSEGVHALSILVGLSAPSGKTVSVTYATRDGTAIAPTDYGGATGRLTFAPGETAKGVTILVGGDKTPEPDEAFVLELMNPDNATLAGGQQAASIVLADDDGFSPVPTVNTGAGGGGTAKKDVTGPRLALGRLGGLRGTRLSLPIRCPKGESRCAGTISLFTIADRKHPERRLARVRFTLKGGARRTVALKLSKSARAYVKRLKRVRVRAYAVAEDAAGNVGTAAASATLRR